MKIHPGKKQEVIQILDTKRHNNISIMLSKFKEISYPDMKKAIINLDEGLLVGDNLIALKSFTPTSEEVTLLTPYISSPKREFLGNPEKYYLEIMTIPRVDTRLESFYVRQTFKVKITAVQESVVSIGLAIEETKRSKRFQRSLEIVLAIGNYLNGNTFRGGAYGFKLDALLKLAEIRVSNGKETVMNYIAELSETKYKDIAGMIEDFPHLEGSSKEPLNQVNADLSQIKKGMALVEKEIGQFSPDSTDKLKQLLVSFYDIASVELEHTQTKLQATDKQFKELLAMFGEDDTTDSQTFFAIVWRFVNGIEKAKEDNARRKALAEKAAQAAIVAEKKKN